MQKVALFRRMANREKGEATLKLKDGRAFTLAVNFHAWAVAQDALVRGGKVPSIEQITDRIGKGQLLYIIALFLGALQTHHPDVETTEQAIAIMEAGGGDVSLALMDAMGIARPDPEDIKELGLDGNPQEAQPARKRSPKAGTGDTSSSPRAVSA